MRNKYTLNKYKSNHPKRKRKHTKRNPKYHHKLKHTKGGAPPCLPSEDIMNCLVICDNKIQEIENSLKEINIKSKVNARQKLLKVKSEILSKDCNGGQHHPFFNNINKLYVHQEDNPLLSQRLAHHYNKTQQKLFKQINKFKELVNEFNSKYKDNIGTGELQQEHKSQNRNQATSQQSNLTPTPKSKFTKSNSGIFGKLRRALTRKSPGRSVPRAETSEARYAKEIASAAKLSERSAEGEARRKRVAFERGHTKQAAENHYSVARVMHMHDQHDLQRQLRLDKAEEDPTFGVFPGLFSRRSRGIKKTKNVTRQRSRSGVRTSQKKT